MTSAPTQASESAPSTAAPRRGGGLQRSLGWLVVVVLVLGVAFVAWRISATSPAERALLDPEGRSDRGALALAEILRDQGVDITIARSRADAARAIDAEATLALTDPFALTDEAVSELLKPAERVVLLSDSTRVMRLLDLGEAQSATGGQLAPSCEMPEFARVGTIYPDGVFTAAEGVTGCFVDESGAAAVLVDERGDRRVSLVDGSRLFSNAHLAEDGNAALALALLGQSDRLVWYVPSLSDSDIEGEVPTSLGDLTPPWVTPAILLLLLSGLTAAFALGRRFGPLVAETLPVTVRASETMHGRARLTAKAADAAHAAEALRDGAIRRIARRLGLTARAHPAEVADAAADRLRIPRGSLHALLGGVLPADDAELIDLARQLQDLELAVETSIPTHQQRTTRD